MVNNPLVAKKSRFNMDRLSGLFAIAIDFLSGWSDLNTMDFVASGLLSPSGIDCQALIKYRKLPVGSESGHFEYLRLSSLMGSSWNLDLARRKRFFDLSSSGRSE